MDPVSAWEGKFHVENMNLLWKRMMKHCYTLTLKMVRNYKAQVQNCTQIIFESEQPWVLTSNGTILDQSKKGIIPGLLERWYAERKVLQKNMRDNQAAGNIEETAYWDKRQLVKKINLTVCMEHC